MDNMLRKELQLELQDSVFWTDSTAVLKYIGNEALRLKTFVANRVAIIRETTKVEQWHYINTHENPADCTSRGLTPEQFMANQSWTEGPSILKDPNSHRTQQQKSFKLSEDDNEVRATAFVHHITENTDPLDKLMNHYSSWHHLKRAVAWILKVRENLLHISKRRHELESEVCKRDPCTSKQVANIQKEIQKYKMAWNKETLTFENLNKAEMEIIRYCQHHKFKAEISVLERGTQPVQRHSSILRLDPVLQDCILRVGGRLSKPAMPEESKHPIIMPNGLHPTTLLLRDIHESVGHSGRNYMLSRLRQKYWIPAANAAVRKLLSSCVKCKSS